MKIAYLRTRTNDCDKFAASLDYLKAEIIQLKYDEMNHGEILHRLAEFQPDWILYIGAIPGHHANVPSVLILRQWSKLAPMVHLCCDGSEPMWRPFLEEYDDEGFFALQLNIDGVKKWPVRPSRGLVTLCPISPNSFAEPACWSDRDILCGFSGLPGCDERATFLRAVAGTLGGEVFQWRKRVEYGADDYADFCAFLNRCKLGLNHPAVWSGQGYHVKGRLIELGMAGCLPVEKEFSPTENWFQPGIDYLTYRDPKDFLGKLWWAAYNPLEASQMALRLHKKVMAKHRADHVWNEVLRRIGV
jgi:hypothetical protein